MTVIVAVGNRAVSAEAVPQLTAVARRIPAAATLNAHARLFAGGNAPLPLTLGNRSGDVALKQHAPKLAVIHITVALTLGAADRRGVVVLRAAVIAKMHLCGGIGVGEPAAAVAPAQQQREIERLLGWIAQGPHEHRHWVARALVVAGKNRAERLTTHIGVIDTFIVGPAERITSGVGSRSALPRAGGIPVPGLQWLGYPWLGCLWPGGIGIRLHRQGMGTLVAAIALEQGELTVRQHTEPVLTTIEVPEIERAIGSTADTSRPEATQRHAVVGAVIKIAGITNRIGVIPIQSERPAPAGLRHTPGFRTGTATQQRTQSSQSKRGHGEAEIRPSLPDLNRLCPSPD